MRLASSGREAIRHLSEQSCDLVLMDLELPDIDGYEATQIIRADENISNCLIIALTARAMNHEREKCLAAGMDDYLSKPYSLDNLVGTILKHYQPR